MIENAKYKITILKDKENNIIQEDKVIIATINSQEMTVPISNDNRHYQEILQWVADGNTIQEAD